MLVQLSMPSERERGERHRELDAFSFSMLSVVFDDSLLTDGKYLLFSNLMIFIMQTSRELLLLK